MSSFENSFEKYKQIFKNIEKLANKYVNLKGSIKFIRTCLNDGLYPKFVHIYIFIIKEIKTSSGLYWVAQAFALLHVLRRQGEIYFSIPKRI